MGKDDPRGLILDSAISILMRIGMAGATIDVIAAEAGLSKGGVLYYFSSKEELLSAAILRHERLIKERRDEFLAKLPPRSGNVLRATVLSYFDYLEQLSDSPHFGIGTLGVPAYLKIVGDMKRRMFRELATDTEHPEILARILLIIDGVWINKLFPDNASASLKKKTMAKILELVEDCCGTESSAATAS